VKTIAIVPAAGIGSRMRADKPKQYLPLNGKLVLEHSLEVLLHSELIQQVYVAVAEHDAYFFKLDVSRHPKLVRVQGGASRAESVFNALEVASQSWPADTLVAVHDAARPGLDSATLYRVLDQAARMPNAGAFVAIPAWDTMKRVASMRALETMDRSELWHAQTPQVFPLQPLHHALYSAQNDGFTITDEASAMERMRWQPSIVEGSQRLRKVTCRDDLIMLSALLLAEESLD